MKIISFPRDEISEIKKRLEEGKSNFTLRVSKEQGKYKKGEKLKASWGDILMIKNVKSLGADELKNEYKYYNELTKEQLNLIGKYPKVDIIELIKC